MADIFLKNYEQNARRLDFTLGVDKNYDVINKDFVIGGLAAGFYFIDGFVQDDIMLKLLEVFHKLKDQDMPNSAKEFSRRYVSYGEVELETDINKAVVKILSGVPCLIVDGYEEAIMIDFRTYPQRGIEEPIKDKVLRGSKDGFIETLVANTALIRRRIRSTDLRMESYQVGANSKTDIVLCYMEDRVDQKFLKELSIKIETIKIDALTMNQESLAECLFNRKWVNPFPKFRFSERPDTAASAILEGSIVVVVDNSPSVMILPTSIFDIIEEANDYYFPPITGTYLRLSRFVINIIAVILTPTWILLMHNPQWIPESLSFILIKDEINIPLILQLLIFEFATDGLRLASITTPSMLSTPLSIVAGIVLGDYTVSSGWFNAETMLYMAFVTIANYTQANFELGYAIKFMRILLLLLTGILGLFGYVGGIILIFLFIALNKTVSGRSYLYPLIPFKPKQLFRKFFRITLPQTKEEK